LTNKTKFYRDLLTQVKALISDKTDPVANMANTSALLFNVLIQVNWIGFYRVLKEGLVLGSFQGKFACV